MASMNYKIDITGKQLTKNWILNLSGQVLPLFVALAAMPYIVRGLGPERFGVLSIVWAVLGSLTLFDLGLGRSTTKYVAECLGRGELNKFPCLFWTSLWSQLLIGFAGAGLMAVCVPYLVDHYLKLAPANAHETKSSFLILAASFPIVLGGNAIRGVLEAAQRFDIVNYVRVPASISIFVFSAIALPLGLSLPSIVILLVASRIVVALIYFGVCVNLFPMIHADWSLDLKLLRALLTYGGWVSISNFVAPLLSYADRFVIGSVLGMASVSYYTAPNEAITKASLLPGTLLVTLFPALASLDASGARNRVRELCARAIKSLLLLMTPILLVVSVFARQILQLWLGSDFATRSTSVLQIFCVGVLVNAISFVPFYLLQGLGRPDITAKIHMFELPVYAIALAILLPRMGLAGAALAWTLRLTLDASLLFASALWLKLLSISDILDTPVRRALLLLCGLAGLLALPTFLPGKISIQLLFVTTSLLAFVLAVWKYVFDAKDRDLLLAASLQIRSAMGRSK
jgi:O-antigen/teichoic acid export membrane protein